MIITQTFQPTTAQVYLKINRELVVLDITDGENFYNTCQYYDKDTEEYVFLTPVPCFDGAVADLTTSQLKLESFSGYIHYGYRDDKYTFVLKPLVELKTLEVGEIGLSECANG